MSVEEARRRLWDSLMEFEDSFSDDLDRLILEVQAEMPCWEALNFCDKVVGFDGKNIRQPPCPSCTARMKLKETADEPLPGTRAD